MNPAYINRVVRGSCPDCGALKAAGRSRCATHLATHRERARACREKERDCVRKGARRDMKGARHLRTDGVSTLAPCVRWFGHWSTRTRAQARDALKSFKRNYPGRKFRIVPEASGGLSGLFWVIQIGVSPGDEYRKG